MNAPDQALLPDVQSSPDARDIAISRVGVRSLRYPLPIRTAHGPLTTVASIEMDVALPGERKGTHMSRFVEVLQEHREPLSIASMPNLLTHMLTHLGAQEGSVDIRFPYFIRKNAPVSGAPSLMDYEVALHAAMRAGHVRLRQKVVVPVTSLCPCSKEVADYGAHNQRSHISIDLELSEPVSVEAQVRIAEEAASCELWAVLKRPDEKYVTQRAYDNPKFVEDTVRDIAVVLER
ncbi:MAG TPA: GTP cyclohydrolase FolE2, partial [Burkholderiaceae bacterium]|nr:GTP cyclohydrolase FolE2 [Burkholderiaceae bacterium]